MGRDFHEHFAAARCAYEEASGVLDLDLVALCFGNDPRLGLTEYAQPAILATEIAMLRAIETRADLAVAAWGGHSLGEYTALVAAGVLPLATALRVDIANDSSRAQVVLSGLADDVRTAEARLAPMATRLVALDVSAPFHSRFLADIEPACEAGARVLEVGRAAPLRGFSRTIGVAVEPITSVHALAKLDAPTEAIA